MSAARPNAPQVRTTSLMSVALRVPPLLDHLMCSPSILIKLRVLCREWKQKSDSVDLDRFTRATFREKDVWPPDARLLDEFHSFFRCRMRICQLRIERKLCFDGTKETQETSTVAACWSVARAAATLFTPQRIPHQTEFHQEVNNFAIDDLLLRVRRSPELAAVGCHILSRAPRLIEPFIDVCDEGHKCGHSPLNEVGFALQDDASCVRASQLLVAMAIPDCVDTIVTTLCTGKTPGQTGWMARGSPLSDGVRRCLDFVEFGVDSPQSSQSSARSSSEQIRLVAAANVIVWLTALYCLSNDTTVLRAVAALGFAPHLLRLSLPGKVQVHSQIRCLAACLVRTTLHEVLSFAPPGSELHLSESFQHFPDALEDDDGGEALASSPPSLARTRSRPRAPSREHPNRLAELRAEIEDVVKEWSQLRATTRGGGKGGMVELDATREGLYPSQEDAAGAVDYLIPAEMLDDLIESTADECPVTGACWSKLHDLWSRPSSGRSIATNLRADVTLAVLRGMSPVPL